MFTVDYENAALVCSLSTMLSIPVTVVARGGYLMNNEWENM
jgi:hypothetical protein